MEYKLKIGGVGLQIISDTELSVEQSFTPFFASDLPDNPVRIKFANSPAPLQTPALPQIGADLLLRYYRGEVGCLCATPGPKGPQALCFCNPDYSRISCRKNTPAYRLPQTLGNSLRMLPMRRILQAHGILFLHASQIAIQGRGILFTAPSGTGKTTQAGLWEKYRDAEIICNDRTLVREGRTYGYPADGSEPVRSGKVFPLGAVVVLAQARENTVRRLRPGEALAALLPQVVFDTWDPQARALALEQLSALLENRPVYRLQCTPDERAVSCLETCLRKDGILK